MGGGGERRTSDSAAEPPLRTPRFGPKRETLGRTAATKFPREAAERADMRAGVTRRLGRAGSTATPRIVRVDQLWEGRGCRVRRQGRPAPPPHGRSRGPTREFRLEASRVDDRSRPRGVTEVQRHITSVQLCVVVDLTSPDLTGGPACVATHRHSWWGCFAWPEGVAARSREALQPFRARPTVLV